MLEGFSKDGNSHIGQDSFVRNLDLAGLELNRIGINAVAFEYSPWANPGDAAGTKYHFFIQVLSYNLLLYQ